MHRKRTQSAVDRAIARLAARQDGVVSLEQLLALGLTYDAVRARVRRGLLHPIHRGVYAVGHTKLSPRGHLIAALLACGPDSFLSHRTTAAVYGLRPIATRSIELTLPAAKARSRKGLLIHRTSVLGAKDVRVRDRLRVSSVARMLLELAPRETPAETDRLITQAVRKGLLDIDAVQTLLAHHPHRPGTTALAHAMHAYLPGPERRSGFERDFDPLIAADPEIPEPLRNAVFDGWEIDYYWPEARFAVELDGRPYHIAVRDQEKDKYRDAKLLRAGITTMRITDTRFALDPQGVLDDVRAMASRKVAA